ncbi:MAG: hypothetical protein ACM3NQ_14805 [Bacteroidales bacterium]
MRLTRNATLGVVFAIALVLGSAGVASAQNPPAQQTPPPAQQQQAPGVVFTGDSAIVLHYIKADKTADFEAAMGKVKEALVKSQSPERKQQAASWKIYKAAEPAGEGQVLYLFVIDPVVKGANYSVGTILGEGFPAEANAIFKSYADAYSKGQVRMNLNLVLNMGQ